MNFNDVVQNLETWFDEGHFATDLSRRVAYRTVSSDPHHRSDLYAYLNDVVGPELEQIGFSHRLLENPVPTGPPFLLATRHEADHLPTVLLYGHGDVVEGHEGQWSDGLDPWSLTERAGAWYGRGAADNKGQHAVNFAALREVIAARGGLLGYNVKVIIETGEECSSPGLRELAQTHREDMMADVFLGSDGPRITEGALTLFLGSRGSVVFELSWRPRETPLHSGNWGGLVSNPATVLTHAIGSLVGRHGRILVEGLLPPQIPEDVRVELAALPIDEEHLGRPIDDTWGEPGLSRAEQLLGWNTLEVLTLHAGDDAKPVNAVPDYARAYCQLRFVVGTRVGELEKNLRHHLDENGFEEIEIRIVRGSPATRISPSNPWVGWAKKAVATATGTPPLVNPNIGGTVPNDVFADILALPTIWVPHSYPGCQQHGPNEHLPFHIARQGLAVMAALFWQLGVTDPVSTSTTRHVATPGEHPK